MMTSRIADLYAALEAMTITAGGHTITARAGTSLAAGIAAADLPGRILLPLDNVIGGSLAGIDIRWDTLSRDSVEARWRVADLCLWTPIGLGSGIGQSADDLIAYSAAYIDAIRAVALPTGFEIEDLSITPGVYEMPAGGDVFYYGIMAILEFAEEIA